MDFVDLFVSVSITPTVMRQAAAASTDFQTSNNFYHQLTSQSQEVVTQ